MDYNEFQTQHFKLIKALKKYLNNLNFLYYFEDSIPDKAPRRPDIIGQENNEMVLYEVKSGKYINFFGVLEQLNQYIQGGKYKRGYLVISKGVNIPTRAKKLYEEQGFGILELDISKVEPEPKKILESEDHTKKSKEFIEYSKYRSKWAQNHPGSLSYLKEILIFVLCGEFLVNGIWELISTQYLIYLWVVIPTSIILVIVFFYLYRKENRNK